MTFDIQASDASLLLVDDEENILRSLQRLFIPLGYEVLTATGGQAALQLLAEHDVDVIVSDMRMPEMDGAEFLSIAAEKWPESKRLLLTGYSDIESAIRAINHGRIDAYLNKPWQDNELEAAVAKAVESKMLKARNKILEQEIRQKNQDLEQLNQSLEEKVVQRTQALNRANYRLKTTYQSTLEVLANLVIAHEGECNSHIRDIAETSQLIASRLQLNEEAVEAIYFACLLHSVGKIGFDRQLLAKPYYQLNETELKEYQQYPLIGEATLMAFEPLKDVAAIIAAHRERFDGGGFPRQLSNEEIPLGARIIAIVLDYYNLQNGQLVADELTAALALDFIEAQAGKRYDTQIASLFIEHINQCPMHLENLQERVLEAENLEAGMILTRALLTAKGMMLLPKGQTLSARHLEKLKQLNDIVAYVKN